MPSPSSIDVKWIIIRHYLGGISSPKSARMLFKSERTVDRVRAVFRKYGEVNDPFKPRAAGGRILSGEVIDVS
jgi:hypothetical protein